MNVLANGDITALARRAELCAFILDRPLAEGQLTVIEALRLGVDPLDLCARRFALGDALVMQRAADWAGLEFAGAVPPTIRGSAHLRRLDGLATARAIHAEVDGEARYYFAPRIDDILALRDIVARGGLSLRLILTPWTALRHALAETNAPALLADARQRLTRRWPHATASLDLGRPARFAFVGALMAMVAFTAIAPLVARPLLLPFLLIVIVAPALLRLLASFHRPVPLDDPPLPDADLPRYTVLVPLRDEAGMVPQLVAALGALDYPPEKLDILFLVESRSPDTIAAVEAHLHDARFELFVIPDGPPHTKPKALDFVLPLVRGEHVVVFDAEDIPAREQLRRAAERFAAHPELDCLQAELRVDNGAENWLTALFAGEYAGLFTLLLPWLARHGLPLPLGGTSNHFRTPALLAIGGWDAFNVTEDADLGVRLARLRSRTGTFAVATAEEAPIRLSAWMRQRTRWMKGWMRLSRQRTFVNVCSSLRLTGAQPSATIATLLQHYRRWRPNTPRGRAGKDASSRLAEGERQIGVLRFCAYQTVSEFLELRGTLTKHDNRTEASLLDQVALQARSGVPYQAVLYGQGRRVSRPQARGRFPAGACGWRLPGRRAGQADVPWRDRDHVPFAC